MCGHEILLNIRVVITAFRTIHSVYVGSVIHQRDLPALMIDSPDFPSHPLGCGQLTIHPALYSPLNKYEIPFHLYGANHMLQIRSLQDH